MSFSTQRPRPAPAAGWRQTMAECGRVVEHGLSGADVTPEGGVYDQNTEARQATRLHPFTAALEARDHAALVETLAPDVVLHSAVTMTPFEGRETVSDVYASVIESFEEVDVVDELSEGDTVAFFWRGRIEGRFVEGADRLRLDGAGAVREITIMGRPLSGLATFLTGIGPRFAGQRRGRAVATALRLTARPLPPMLGLLDPVTRWMARPGRQRAR